LVTPAGLASLDESGKLAEKFVDAILVGKFDFEVRIAERR
jgi:hypothetical protein